jgi:formylglycine-generating enzyme required for sulfatase activity
MFDKATVRLLLAAALLASATSTQADVFHLGGTQNADGTWTGLASLQFVTVGDAGNMPDMTVMQADGTTGYGSVPYAYQMGTYDVTAAQYAAFLNAVADTDPYGLYNPNMASTLNGCGISRSGSSGSYTYSTTKNGNFPVNYVSWGDAARFCNWLQNGQPTGTEGNGTTETGAYALNSDTTNLSSETRNPGATYFIPTENEWYKAAYYRGGGTNSGYWLYPTKSNAAPGNTLPDTGDNANCWNGGYADPTNYLTPVGDFVLSPGPYGTFDQGGDLWQWNETEILGGDSDYTRGLRGGDFADNSNSLASSTRIDFEPTYGYANFGFRVAASVPEPASIALLLAGAVALGIWRRRRKA